MSLENVSKLVTLKNEKILKVQAKKLPTGYRNRHENMDCLPFVKRSYYLCANLAEFSGKMRKQTSRVGQEAFSTRI